MDKKTVDISPIGIDRRPVKRQQTPGLCKSIVNLRPTGPTKDPYWVAEPNVDQLKNSGGIVFNPGEKSLIVEAGWHVRGSLGEFVQTGSQSLKRLVCIFSDGWIRVYDPELTVAGWGLVTERKLTDPGVYDGQFIQFNNSLVINCTNNGQAYGMFFLVDDIIIRYKFPELPPISISPEVEKTYSDEEIETLGETRDSIMTGSLYVRYAYELFDGTLIYHSTPQYVALENSIIEGENKTYRLIFRLFEATQQSNSLDFWIENISNVAVLIGGFKPLGDDGEPQARDEEDLKNILFYRATYLPFSKKLGNEEETVKEATFKKNEQLWSTLELADIDMNSAHAKRADIIHTFNSRLLLGGMSVDFSLPSLRSEGISNSEAPPFSAKTNIIYGELVIVEENGEQFYEYEPDTWEVDIFGVDLGPITIDEAVGFDQIGATDDRITASVSVYSDDIRLVFTVSGWRVEVNKDDYLAQDFLSFENFTFVGVGADPDLKEVIIGVDIKTSKGVYKRVSGVTMAKVTDGAIGFSGKVFSYPDRRATTMKVWVNDGLGWILHSVNKLTGSSTQNIAFLPSASIDDQVVINEPVYQPAVNNVVEYVPNRVAASEVNNPFQFFADKVYRVGEVTNKITGFASNALAVSQGQFGQYPLFVMMQNMIYALEQSSNALVAFGRISPVSLNRGVAHRRALVNVGRLIVFVYKDGLFTLDGGQIEEIAHEIGNYPGAPEMDYSAIHLASRQREGSSELIISTGTKYYIFNTRYGRWFESNKARKGFFMFSGELYSIDQQGNIYDEYKELNTDVDFELELDPVHFMQPELLKRLFALYIRGNIKEHTLNVWFEGSSSEFSTSNMAMRFKHRSVFSFRIRLTGSMAVETDYLQSLSAQIEARHPQRTKIGV